jgi:hypothetical protein
MRHPYKMRRVVEKFDRHPKLEPTISIPMERLECGHTCHDRDALYGNETAVRIHAMGRAMSGESVYRRCYECGKEVAKEALPT